MTVAEVSIVRGWVLQSVPEIVEPFVPLPDDLMANLKESRAVIDTLLDSLPTAFGRTGTVSPSGAGLGVACEEQAVPVWGSGCCSASGLRASQHCQLAGCLGCPLLMQVGETRMGRSP